MFEKPENQRPGSPKPEIFLAGGEPVEFTHNGQRFRIHTILSSWHESGGWWNRISDGKNRVTESTIFDDGARAIWRVEAAPEGALTTFEIELDEVTKTWLIRPTSRPQ